MEEETALWWRPDVRAGITLGLDFERTNGVGGFFEKEG